MQTMGKNLKKVGAIVFAMVMFVSLFAGVNMTKAFAAANVPVEGITVTNDKETNHVYQYEYLQMKAIITPDNATTKDVEWSVSDTSIAAIERNGSFRAVTTGTVEVIATATDGSGVVGKQEITITPYPQVEVTPSEDVSVVKGKSMQFTAKMVGDDSITNNFTWELFVVDHADYQVKSTIDENGLFTASYDEEVKYVTLIVKHKDDARFVRYLQIKLEDPVLHKFTLTDGVTSDNRSEYAKDDKVTITANKAPEGKVFKEWQVVKGDVKLENANAETTTFVMADEDVEIKAVYEDKKAENKDPENKTEDKTQTNSDEKTEETPKTGDSNMPIMLLVLALISGASVVYLGKKKTI